MEPHYADDSVVLYHGNCLDVIRELPDNSVDAVVTDPPYDLTASKKGGTGQASMNLDSPYGRSRIGTGNGGFMGKDWDSTGIAFDPQTWIEVMRVLKPGGHLLSFGGSRTWHRLMVAVEDAGFEIRDSIAWLYGSGFPKSLDVSKAIDKAAGAEREVVGQTSAGASSLQRASRVKQGYRDNLTAVTPEAIPLTAPATAAAQQWQGWGTALKPAFEPIVVGRKPLPGTVASNILEHGTGALNIDGCRIEGEAWKAHRATGLGSVKFFTEGETPVIDKEPHAGGRWPTNVVLDESQAAELDAQTANTRAAKGSKGSTRGGGGEVYGGGKGYAGTLKTTGQELNGYEDGGGASRFFPTFHYEAKAPHI